MFIYSSDELIKINQEIEDDKTQKLIEKYVNIEHSQLIEDFFDNNCDNFQFLIDFTNLIKSNNNRIIIPCIGRTESSPSIKYDIDKGFSLTSKYIYDYIPFIKFTFMEIQKYNGVSLKEVYMIFFNKHNKFKDIENNILYYLNRFNKMKAFI